MIDDAAVVEDRIDLQRRVDLSEETADTKDLRPILVTGSHRSGTTWIGRILALSPIVWYWNEPLNPRTEPGNAACRVGVPYWYAYLRDVDSESIRRRLEHRMRLRPDLRSIVMSLRSLGEFKSTLSVTSRIVLHRLRRGVPLIKDPFAVFSAPGIADDYGCRVLVVIRHPAAVVESAKRRGWSFDFDNLLRQPHLMEDLLSDFADEMQRCKRTQADVIGETALLWKVIYSVVDRYRSERPDWLFVRHEDIAQAPVREFRRLYRLLGLQWSAAIESHVQQICAGQKSLGCGRAYDRIVRDSKTTIAAWKTELTAPQVNRIREIVEPTASRFYDECTWTLPQGANCSTSV